MKCNCCGYTREDIVIHNNLIYGNLCMDCYTKAFPIPKNPPLYNGVINIKSLIDALVIHRRYRQIYQALIDIRKRYNISVEQVIIDKDGIQIMFNTTYKNIQSIIVLIANNNRVAYMLKNKNTGKMYKLRNFFI